MKDEEQILAAEKARASAVMNRDIEALDDCLAEGLIYVHATGTVHERAQLLEYIRVGPRFHEVRLEPKTVRIFGQVGVIFGELHILLQRPGEDPVLAHSHATAIWLKQGDVWRLVSFQSTRSPERK